MSGGPKPVVFEGKLRHHMTMGDEWFTIDDLPFEHELVQMGGRLRDGISEFPIRVTIERASEGGAE